MAEIATAAGSKAVEKVTEIVYDSICQKISYVFKYQNYMEKAKERVEDLRSRRQDVEADVDVAERQGEEIYNEVKDWLRSVEGFMERVVKLVDDEDKAKRRCFKGLCPNLIKRYKLGKEAEKVAEDARTLVVLNQMKTQKYVSVEPLADDDARTLFAKIVGDLTDKRDIAAEIIKKCAGLPLAITTIANALKGKSDPVWRDALHQLKSYNPRCVPEMDNTLYSTFELSYKLLNSEEAKSLLLLCALFNAGCNIHFFSLLAYGMGLGLFQFVYTINDGRNRLNSLIDYLKASSLLLKSNNNEMVKMHDVIHFVVVSIAKEKCMFNIQDGNGFKEVLVKKMYKDSIAISLPWRDIDGLPERFIWHNKSHGDSLSKLKEVRVKFCETLMTIVPSNSTQGLLTF
ncbi:hypothetical protein Pint_06773 [Pistacia integerrima]|uniref:Uncharacterized protein n=1 Tax=Pistacia integerrima TaxID=434235 RepID=A0ACC0XTQ8_9ROSI|nr:hypothetical protein Pint_06773 [Pistacia integerrima]